MNLKKLPKIMLNLSFESSVSYDDIKYYSSLNEDELKDELFFNDKDDINSYNKKINFAIDYLQTSNKLKKAAYDLALKLKEDNICYAEIVVTPKLHMKEELSVETIINSVRNGFKAAEADKYNILIGVSKSETIDYFYELGNIYQKYKDDGVCGISIIGESLVKRIYDYKNIFNYLNENEIPFAFNCDSYDTPDEMLVLVKNNVKRIIGGLNSMIDFAVMGEAILKRVLFVEQIKPLIVNKELDSYMDDKIKNMLSSGANLAVSIHSLTIENCDLTLEFEHLINCQMFTEEEILKMNKNALIYSFLNVMDKQYLIEKIEKIKNSKKYQ